MAMNFQHLRNFPRSEGGTSRASQSRVDTWVLWSRKKRNAGWAAGKPVFESRVNAGTMRRGIWNMELFSDSWSERCVPRHMNHVVCNASFLHRTRHMRHFALLVLCAVTYWIVMTQEFTSDNFAYFSGEPHIFDGIFSARISKPTWETCSWKQNSEKECRVFSSPFQDIATGVDVESVGVLGGQPGELRHQEAKNAG